MSRWWVGVGPRHMFLPKGYTYLSMVWDHLRNLRFPFQALGREVCPLQKGTPTRSQECPSYGTEGSEDIHAKSEKEGKHHFQRGRSPIGLYDFSYISLANPALP